MFIKLLSLICIFFFVSGVLSHANAQMMNYSNSSVNSTDLQQQQQDEAQGKALYDKLQNKQTTCQKLTKSDFEKIGEYVMSQRFGDTNTHIQVNNNIKRMMGNTGEENMHSMLGVRATGCNRNLSEKGGKFPMMGWGSYGMMNGNFGAFGVLALVGWIVVLIDLILAGIWLWQQISRNKRK